MKFEPNELLAMTARTRHEVLKTLLSGNEMYQKLLAEKTELLHDRADTFYPEVDVGHGWGVRLRKNVNDTREYEERFIQLIRDGERMQSQISISAPAMFSEAYSLLLSGDIDGANESLVLDDLQQQMLLAHELEDENLAEVFLDTCIWKLSMSKLSTYQFTDEDIERLYKALLQYDSHGCAVRAYTAWLVEHKRTGEAFEVAGDFVIKAQAISLEARMSAVHIALPVFYEANQLDNVMSELQILLNYYREGQEKEPTKENLIEYCETAFRYAILAHNMELENAEQSYRLVASLLVQLEEQYGIVDWELEGHLHNNLGCLFARQGDMEEAERLFEGALKNFSMKAFTENDELSLGLSIVYNNMSVIFRMRDDEKQAKEFNAYATFIINHLATYNAKYEDMENTIMKNGVLTRFWTYMTQPFDI